MQRPQEFRQRGRGDDGDPALDGLEEMRREWGRSGSLEDLLGSLSRSAAELAGARRLALYRLDRERELLLPQGGTGLDALPRLARGSLALAPDGDDLATRVL